MRDCPMTSSPPAWIHRARSLASGGNGFLSPACLASRRGLAAGVRPAFPPSLVVQVKALACELPHRLGLPLSRLSVEEIRQHVIAQGLVAGDQRGDIVALAQRRRPSPLATPKLGLSA